MPLPGPSSIKLNFLGFPKLSQKETVQIANISPNKNEIIGDNPVTQIDLNSQDLIVNKIKKQFPDHEILGEEGKEEKKVKTDFIWIIDTIDGTKNFINQIPFYCVSIAVMHKKEIIGGAVGLPWEKKSVIYAIKNQGIKSNFAQKNSQRLLVGDGAPGATQQRSRRPAEQHRPCSSRKAPVAAPHRRVARPVLHTRIGSDARLSPSRSNRSSQRPILQQQRVHASFDATTRRTVILRSIRRGLLHTAMLHHERRVLLPTAQDE